MHQKILPVLQWVFGVYFIAIGVMHFIVPEGLPSQMAWMYELSDTQHLISGVAEILGGLGLILPMVTGIQPNLTVLAALGLFALMLAAIVFHIGREEFSNIPINVINAAVMAYIAYGRARLAPLPSR